MLKRIFGTKGDDITQELRRVHQEFKNLYSSTNIFQVIKSRRMRWVGHVPCMGESRKQGFGGKHEGKISLGRPKHRRNNNDIMPLQEMALRGTDWTDLAQYS
jgi:hypothetical protein